MGRSEKTPITESPIASNFAATSRTQSGEPDFETASAPHMNLRVHSKALSLDTEYKGSIIPPSSKARHKQRTLVLCFDGTGDQFDNDNSNVVNFFSLLAKGQSKQQLVYYQVGTYFQLYLRSHSLSVICLGWYWDIYDSPHRYSMVFQVEENC